MVLVCPLQTTALKTDVKINKKDHFSFSFSLHSSLHEGDVTQKREEGRDSIRDEGNREREENSEREKEREREREIRIRKRDEKPLMTITLQYSVKRESLEEEKIQ